MAGFLKKIFSFGKKEVVESPAETPSLRTSGEELAPINWAALKDLTKDDEGPEASAQEEPDLLAREAEAAGEAEAQAASLAEEQRVAEERERLAAEASKREADETATRRAAEAEALAQQEAARQAEQQALLETARAAAEQAAKEAAERAAREEQAAAHEEAVKREAAKKAAEEAENLQAAKQREAEAAAARAAQEAAEQAAREQQAAVEAARREAEEKKAAEEAAAKEAEIQRAADQARREADAAAAREAAARRTAEQAKRAAEAKAADDAAKEAAWSPGLRTGGDELAAPAWMTQPAQAKLPETEEEDSDPTGKVLVGKAVEQKQAKVVPKAEPKLPWFQRLRAGLLRSSRELSGNIAGVFTKRKLDEDTLQDLEDVLLRADLGLEIAMRVTDTLSASRYGREISDLEVRTVMGAEIEKVLGPVARPLELDLQHRPHVILVVGVNGTGKTTTIGKLAAKLTEGGLSVMLAAGDTFRAAAIEQLKIWGERTGSPVISSKLGADAAGLAYDAFEQAKAAGSDVLIIDTAGRLQNKTELMAELEKIVRVLGKLDPDAPHTVLQTIDATTGQNALNQVEIFRNVAGVNGLVLTKLDGTARGGILVAIAAKHKLPVYFIGVGEQVDDLEPFVAGDFAKAIAGVG